MLCHSRHRPTLPPFQRDGTKITRFEDCDFTPMFNHFEAEKAKRKAMTTAEKKAAKAEKDGMEEPFKTCLLDGRKEKIGNFRIEPPGLFRGRGDHPKKGALKVLSDVNQCNLILMVAAAAGHSRGYHDQYWQRRAYPQAKHAWQVEGDRP